ncbi:MAG TPA: hypothetical protein VK611_07510 [Acidimicrobiales bacterium]|nr:hypothetical protein [Acidimicrobiales bacterium]
MTVSTCEVCGQLVQLALNEWVHTGSGTWAVLPVRHRAQVVLGSVKEARS